MREGLGLGGPRSQRPRVSPGIAAGNSLKGSGGGDLWPQPGAWRRPWLLGGLP